MATVIEIKLYPHERKLFRYPEQVKKIKLTAIMQASAASVKAKWYKPKG